MPPGCHGTLYKLFDVNKMVKCFMCILKVTKIKVVLLVARVCHRCPGFNFNYMCHSSNSMCLCYILIRLLSCMMMTLQIIMYVTAFVMCIYDMSMCVVLIKSPCV